MRPVSFVDIRELGIPTVVDRFVQQAILQVLGPRFGPTFSRYGYERSGASDLMERVCERANLQAALKRVRKNKGSAGIDGAREQARRPVELPC